MKHPLYQFQYCPVCGAKAFDEENDKAKKCKACGFTYYFNPSSAVACFIKNAKGELMVVRRANEPAKGTYDLPGGFVDMFESIEDAAHREVMEETGLAITNCRYLFSIPNLYKYAGFQVHTVDAFLECLVDDFGDIHPEDDVAEIMVLRPEEIKPECFGLQSISKGVSLYLDYLKKEKG